MAKFQLEIPEELLKTIENMGFDLNSYFMTQFLNPLLEKYKEEQKGAVLKDRQEEIDSKVDEVKDATDLTVIKAIIEEVPPEPISPEEPPREDELPAEPLPTAEDEKNI